MRTEKIYITGRGIINPAGNDIQNFWKNILKGINFFEKLDIEDDTPVKVGARIKNFNPQESISKRIIIKTDPFTHYFLAATSEAIKESRIEINEKNATEIGIFFGNNSGGWKICERGFKELFGKDYSLVNPWQATAWFPTAGQGYASIIYGIKGYSKTFVADRVSSAAALYHAVQSLENKKNTKVLVGGAEAPLTGLGTICYNENGTISHELSEYICRPFLEKSKGTVLSEGGSAIILETTINENSNLIAEVSGCATNYYATEQVEGVIDCMKKALKNAGLSIADIDLIIPEGNGDWTSDSIEKEAILELLTNRETKMPILFTKFYFGHQYGAALITDIICACMAICYNQIPQYPYIQELGEPFTDKIHNNINNILVNSRTSEGVNYTFIISRVKEGGNKMYNNILEYLRKKISELGFEEDEIQEDLYIRDDLGLDSSEVVEISLHIKSDYGIEMNLKEDMKICDIVNMILGRKK